MRLRNRLWNPEHEWTHKRKKTLKVNHNLDDLICQKCPNREVILPSGEKLPCQNVCYPLSWTDGNTGLKETLLDRPIEPSSDYNDVLADGINSRRIDYTKVETNKLKVKGVAVLLQAEFTIKEISQLLKCSRRSVYRMRIK